MCYMLYIYIQFIIDKHQHMHFFTFNTVLV